MKRWKVAQYLRVGLDGWFLWRTELQDWWPRGGLSELGLDRRHK